MLVLLVAMALDTRVVRVGSSADAVPGTFSPAAFGSAEFPKVRDAVEARAADAPALAAEIAKDEAGAIAAHGANSPAGPAFAVRFTGTAGKQDFGVYDIAIPGMPPSIHVTLQTGPAILGTALRDVSGKIQFGQFENQIQYQNAGSGLNREMKKEVLSKLDVSNLTGKTLTVVGAFEPTDPTTWEITPVSLEVK